MKKKNNVEIDNTDIGDYNIKNSNLKLTTITCLILALIIMVIHNTNINLYIRDLVIPFGVMLVGYLFLVNKNKLEKNKKAYILLIPIIFILLSDVLMNIDVSNKFLNTLILPLLISTFFFLLVNKNYKITKESLLWAFKLFPTSVFRNLKYIENIFSTTNRPKTKMIFNIILGSLIGIPISLVLLFLLANADKYFSEFVSYIFNFIPIIFRNDVWISNILIIIIAFVILFSIFINILKNKNIKLEELSYNKVNNTITFTILVIINIVFILFLISEISKLTFNFLQLPIEYTYAEYAREGFFQLLAVTIINFSIILYYVYFTEVLKNSKIIKKMLLLLITFSIILIFNSYYRMFLYIGKFGFTILRLQVILFLSMELTLFAVLVKKMIYKLKYNDEVLFAIIMLLFYILNIYFCTKDFVNLLG